MARSVGVVGGLRRWLAWCHRYIIRCWPKRAASTGETRVVDVGVANKNKNNEIKTSRYSLLTFVPRNLSEQFRRVIHIYFVVITVIALVIDSPVSPLTSIVPLGFMVLVSGFKTGYEDWLRHKADDRVNSQIVEIVKKGEIKKVRNSKISPGTLVRVQEGGQVPADLVLLCSEGSKGKCFVTTANLDGDTNLKTLRVPPPLVGYTPESLPHGLRIEIPNPVADMTTFYGRLKIPGTDSLPLSTDKLMLRGSRVLNTEWALGCAVYTGEETKLALISKFKSNKVSSCESTTNRCLYIFISIIILEIFASYISKRYIDVTQQRRDLYLGLGAAVPQPFTGVLQDILSFLLLYYYIIPMSLFVTIELYKFFGALYIRWDEDLRCPETGLQALANTSDLNQELGQVEVLFCDKTGTLTKNLMTFRACSIRGEVYEKSKKILYNVNKPEETVDTGKADVKFFFTILALCHSAQISTADVRKLGTRLSGSHESQPRHNGIAVNGNVISNGNGVLRKPTNGVPYQSANEVIRHSIRKGIVSIDDKTDNIHYQASSPDDKALVEAAHRFGVTFLGEEGDNLYVRVGNDIEIFEKLQLVEFTTERNRMSVIVRDKKGKIWLFCKGAESSVFPLCQNEELVEETNRNITAFSSKGLRTLAIAYREVSEDEYEEVCQCIQKQAVNSAVDLEQLTHQFRVLEHKLSLIGATAVEDSLQDDVTETLVALRSAGIKIWMLTGDKVETAINVAQSCAYISENAKQMFIIHANDESAIRAHMEECERIIADGRPQELTLVIDGTSMAQILEKSVAQAFAEMSLKCNAVLCCRLSPIQKAQIVKLIKNSPGRPITAAIGDGANDISMVQEAHVGLGIYGKEDHQAARSADYAFAKFSMLKKMLLVTGHWYYERYATLIHYSFYKNIMLGNIMLFFQISSAFSTQSIYDSMYLTIYNLFTALPCMVLSVTEQRLPAELLIRKPSLYRSISKNQLMSWRRFSGWMLIALYHSVVIYVAAALTVSTNVINADMMTSDLWSFGGVLYHLLVLQVNLRLWLQARYHTLALAAAVVLSLCVYVTFNTVYALININIHGWILGTYTRLLASLPFWILNVLVVVTCLAPDYFYRYFSDKEVRAYFEISPKERGTP